MKTEKNTDQNETLDEGINLATKWVNENTKMAADTFQKQMSQTIDMVTKFFNPAMSVRKTGWMPGENLTELYTKNGELFFKNLKSFSEISQKMMNTMFNSFNDYSKQTGYTKGSFDAVMETFEKQVGQMVDYNKQLYFTLRKDFGAQHLEMGAYNEKFEEKMKNDFETSRNAMKKILETYSTKTDFSLDSNKKLIQGINKQIENVMESNKELWKDVMKAFGVKKEEGVKIAKEPSPGIEIDKIKKQLKMQNV
ncbi:MAG: hypothetical protein A3F72_02535 [Bacteroidetes bacterium RIFCSPLOWO2_12_FULL_35_15]|nr:MAG: hypothetical protein A3F72_02535 [Bacteroidetes bacterium RIFCSPLOWO2_12_FULL_35_15]